MCIRDRTTPASCQHGEIAACQDTFGAAGKQGFHREPGRLGYLAGAGRMQELSLHRGEGEVVERLVVRAGHGAVEGDQATTLIEEDMERCDIAVPDEYLGVQADDTLIQKRKDSHCAETAPEAE